MSILIYASSTSASPNDHDRNNLAAIPRCWPLTCPRQSQAERRAQVFDWSRRQNSFSVVPWVYSWLDPDEQQQCQQHLSNRWEPLMELLCQQTLGKFKALPAHFVCKEQIAHPEAESLWVCGFFFFFFFLLPSLISLFSPPAVPSDLGLLFLLLQTSVLGLGCCSKNRYLTSGPAHFDSSQ